jgi:hypothetical protein
MKSATRKLAAVLVIVAALLVTVVEPAHAGSSTDAALALGAFAVFNQIVTGQTIFQQGLGRREVVRETVIVREPAPVVYAPPPPRYVVYAPASPHVVYAPPARHVVYAKPAPVIIYPQPPVYSRGQVTPQRYAPTHYSQHHWKDHRDYQRHHHRHD